MIVVVVVVAVAHLQNIPTSTLASQSEPRGRFMREQKEAAIMMIIIIIDDRQPGGISISISISSRPATKAQHNTTQHNAGSSSWLAAAAKSRDTESE